MRISFLFVAALFLLFASCSKNPITPEVEQMSEETTIVEGRRYSPCHPPKVYNINQLETALNNYDNCSLPGVISPPMVCSDPVGDSNLNLCKYPAYPENFPMTGSQVIQIYNQLTSCSELLTCKGQTPVYTFIFGAYQTETICGDFIQIDHYTLECCKILF